MLRNRRKLFTVFVVAFMFMLSAGFSGNVFAENASNVLSGTYSIVVEGYDWGPSVSKAIVEIDKPITTIDKASLKVVETKSWYAGVQDFDRQVTDVYLSDAKGNKVTGSSKYFTVALYVSPNDGVPFVYNLKTNRNNWAEKYQLAITLAANATVSDGTNTYTGLTINADFTNRILPQADLFTKSEFTSSGIKYSYASYAPAKDGNKHPLVIWLHGGGEGGTNPEITILANKVTAFASESNQKIFGGAYVLAPQCPDMWVPDWNLGQKTNAASPYTETLMALIQNYVSSNPDIDTSKIYIGGCSAGGFMTINMVVNYPKYFAAAYTTCAAYNNDWLTDYQISTIKDVPLWFVYAASDTGINNSRTSIALYDRLKTAGASNVHITRFDKVIDTSGKYFGKDGITPYEYSGHFSWVYFHNNEVVENGTTIKEWLSKQSLKPVSAVSYASAWAVPEVEAAVSNGLVTSDLLSSYQKNITRSEFAKLCVNLYEALSDKVAVASTTNPFVDSKDQEVLKAFKLGIIKGNAGTVFNPDKNINRQEIAVMIYRTMKAVNTTVDANISGAKSFADKNAIASWAITAVNFTRQNDLIKGAGNNVFDPNATTVREQAIILIERTYEQFSK